MSVNSSSIFLRCSSFPFVLSILIAYNVLRTVVILPLSTYVLYLSHQKWRQQRSFRTTSHSDVFTYHMAALELIWLLGVFFFFCGLSMNQHIVTIVGSSATYIVFFGEMFFHMLTCVEWYLAVVHPVAYLGLRTTRGVRVRNVSVGCVWLLCIGLVGFLPLQVQTLDATNLIPQSCLLTFCIVVVSFCNLSVLWVLIRSGPGEGGGDKERGDQSKQRAFHTITAISCVLWLWLVGLLVSTALSASPVLSESIACAVGVSVIWFNLPNSLVSPLLFLHRAGKLSCFCKK